MNSLREGSNDFDIKLVEIRESIRHPANNFKVFILLEGNTDIKLFRNIFSYQYTDIIQVKGKEKVVKALNILIDGEKINIIGIADADFEYLEEVNSTNHFFITDYHDMEIEMIESDGISSVVNEFSQEECYRSLVDNLKQDVYNIAMEIGYIRWYSEKVRLATEKGLFDFKRVKLNSLVSYDNCQILFDLEKFMELLLVQLENSDDINIQEEVNKLKELSTDKLQICNGHDMTTLISNYFPIGNINKDKIEEALRLSYHFSHFKNTNLFQNLNEWANSNNYRLFN